MSTQRTAAQVFPVRDFLWDELSARDWTVDQLVDRMLAPDPALARCTVDLLLYEPCPGVVLGQETASLLARAFGTSAALWLRIDRVWQSAHGVGVPFDQEAGS